MKESRYVKMARTMLQILKHSRIPLFFHRKSNHMFTVWQHVVLLAIRQYEGKSYRLFVEWLLEAHYPRMFLQISKIPHFSTLQKFAGRIIGTVLERIIASFITLVHVRRIFLGIDASGFKPTSASQYYTYRARLNKRRVSLNRRRHAETGHLCNQVKEGPLQRQR